MVPVKRVRDFAWGEAADIFGNDPADHPCLFLDNLPFSRLSGDRGIAIGQAAGKKARGGAALLPAPYFMRVILSIELTDQAAQPDEDCIYRALVHRADLHTLKCQAFMDAGEILHIARQAVQGLDNDDLYSSVPRIRHQSEQAVTARDRPARARAIGMCGDDVQALALCICAA